MFILNVSYSKNPSEVEPHIKSHGVWVGRYLKEGVFLFAGPKKSGLGGVIAVQSMGLTERLRALDPDGARRHPFLNLGNGFGHGVLSCCPVRLG